MAASINSLSSDSIELTGVQDANTQAQAEIAQIQTAIARLRASMRVQDIKNQAQIKTVRLGLDMILSRLSQSRAKQNTKSYSFPLLRGPIRMQDANTQAQMGTAQLCAKQIKNIKEIVQDVKIASQALSKAEWRLEVIQPFFDKISNRGFVRDYKDLERNTVRALRRAQYCIHDLEARIGKTRNKSTLERIKALLPEARNAHTELEEIREHNLYKFRKIAHKTGYVQLQEHFWKAQVNVWSEKYSLEQAKQPWREALNSLKTEKTDPPSLQERCIETICGAISPICTETDLKSLEIPTASQLNITTFCDCLYLIQFVNEKRDTPSWD